MKKRSMGLSIKIIGIVVILFVIVLGLITMLVSRQIREGVTETQRANMEQSSRLLRAEMDQVIEVYKLRLAHAAGQTAILRAYQDKNPAAALQVIAEANFGGLVNADNLKFADADGNIVASYPKKKYIGMNVTGDEGWLPISSLSTSCYIDSYPHMVNDGTFILSLYAPVVVNGKFAGIMIASLDMIALSEDYIFPEKYGESGYAYLFDDRGNLIAKEIALDECGKDISNTSYIHDIITSSETSGFVYYESDRQKGLMRYQFFQKLESMPWIVTATIDEKDLIALSLRMRNQILIISAVSLAALIIIMIFGIMLMVGRPISKIANNLASGSNNLEAASYQISSSSQELSSGSSMLASSIEEITSSLEELQSVVELNTKNINQSELMMKETNEGAQKVTAQMVELKTAINEIGENSRKIEKIIKVIEDIAFQTNILALNAAVEAARAGEAGRGFAVVADQVKELAHKSSEAAKETSSLIENALDSAVKGETLGSEVLEVQAAAGELAGKVSVLLDEVNRASKEQMKGINQITGAITQTNSVVQQTAAGAEETAAASEELLAQAEGLNGVVDRLNIIVKGSSKRQDAAEKTTEYSRESALRPSDKREVKEPKKEKLKVPGGGTGIDLGSAEEQIPLEKEFSEF